MRFLKAINIYLIFLLLTISCGNNQPTIEDKQKELEELYKDLNEHFNSLHSELEKYATYAVTFEGVKEGFFSDEKYTYYEYFTKVQLKEKGLLNCVVKGEEKGLLSEANYQLSLLRNNYSYTFEQAIQDKNILNQLNLCYNYQVKEQSLVDVLLNLKDALKEIKSEIDFVNTDIKMKKLNDSELIQHIDNIFSKYQKSNYEFNETTTNPSQDVLKAYWEQQLIKNQ